MEFVEVLISTYFVNIRTNPVLFLGVGGARYGEGTVFNPVLGTAGCFASLLLFGSALRKLVGEFRIEKYFKSLGKEFKLKL